MSKRACVKQCPVYNASTSTVTPAVSRNGTLGYTYTYDTQGSQTPAGTPTASDILGYDTSLVLERVCVPNPLLYLNNSMTTSMLNATSSSMSAIWQNQDLSGFISDIKNNWQYLLAATGFALLVGFLFMFLLRCLAGCIVWVSLFGIMFFLIGLGIIFLYNANKLGGLTKAATFFGVPTVETGYNEPIGWSLIGIGCFFFIVILCCCSRIRLAVAVCKSAGQFVASVCLIVLIPIVQSLIAIGIWAGCLVTMVYLVSSATFVGTPSDYFSWVNSYSDPELLRFYGFIFGTLWLNAFIGAMTTFVIASACCMWYYSHAPGSELSLPIWRSYKMVFRYHWGSLAFGSLLLAIVQFLQLIVELFKRQAEGSGHGKCAEYALKCVTCFLQCVECIVKFINTQAYIQIALRGKSFCYAAKDGFELAWSNPLRYAIVGGIGAVIMFLGKLIIAAITATGFYLLITFVDSIKAQYTLPMLQVIIVAVISYLIALLFMAVYSVAMDTLLQCFIVDETNQKAKGKGKPQWAPADLADLMDTENDNEGK